jgi:hypothetical protein
MLNPYRSILLLLALVAHSFMPVKSQGFLKADGKWIVNAKGERVLLRGIGLGGWMLQEGYMLRLKGEGQQYRIRERIKDLIGEEKTEAFYHAWLSGHTQKADIDSLRSWGFNSIRLPMHYRLFTLPTEQEPVKGKHTWLQKGFAMTDSLLSWCKKNRIYLILDLHAAPGGQGNDLNISDRNPNQPSLWESEANQQKMIALWTKLAERYKNEPWIGGYDLLNETNWGFIDPAADKNGLNETKNEPLRQLLMATTQAIREKDPHHMIIIEGNGWANNYHGIFPLWDNNMVVSFHKYWNDNTEESIRSFLTIREKYQVPIWLGETGENSNVWFTEAVRLLEANGIGWSWWPLKKMGINNPLEIEFPKGYETLLNYWNGEGTKPLPEEAYKILMQLARNSRIENCIYHPDVIDALFRQVYSFQSIPFKKNLLGNNTIIRAVDYDLGRSGIAYYDIDSADYHISRGGNWVVWNKGVSYRNDGVDIAGSKDHSSHEYFVTDINTGEWLQYTVKAPVKRTYTITLGVAADNSDGKLMLSLNGADYSKTLAVPDTGGMQQWKTISFQQVLFRKGDNVLRIKAQNGGFNLKYIMFN